MISYYIALMQIPIFLALGVIAWKLSPSNMGLLSESATYGDLCSFGGSLHLSGLSYYRRSMAGCFAAKPRQIDRYSFKQVAVLDLAYMVTFGSELAVVSMLPLFYTDTFGLSLHSGRTAGLGLCVHQPCRPSRVAAC